MHSRVKVNSSYLSNSSIQSTSHFSKLLILKTQISIMNNWVDFPPEILEKILNNVDDRITAENARLVNTIWKQEMDKIIEKKSLFTWTEWQPSRIFSTPLVNSFPTAYWFNCEKTDNYICFPSPSPSLKLHAYYDEGEKPGWKQMKSEEFWNEYGATTRNLVLDGWMPVSFHHRTLSHVPNVEGVRFLQLNGDEGRDIPFLRVNSPPYLPKLKHLEIWDVRPGNPYTWMTIVKWLLEEYANQLVSLKLACNGGSFIPRFDGGLERETLPLTFDNLQFLSLSVGHVRLYESIPVLPKLTHLSIMEDKGARGNPRPMELETLVAFMRFIDRFADTLVKLNLDINISELQNQQEAYIFRTSPKLFPKLTVFAYNFPAGRLESSLLKKWFLKRFPILRTLQFLKFPVDPDNIVEEENESWLVDGMKKLLRRAGFYTKKDRNDAHVMKKLVEKERYWKCVPTLQSTYVRKFEAGPNWEDYEFFTIKKYGL